MILERGEARDDLAVYTEGGNTVRDHLLSPRDDLKDRPAQRVKDAALGLIDSAQVLVNFLRGHDCAVYAATSAHRGHPEVAGSCFSVAAATSPGPIGVRATRGEVGLVAPGMASCDDSAALG